MPVNTQFSPKRYPALLGITSASGEEKHSLADEVYDAILLRVVRGELPGGAELKSTVLAEELEVSRTPVNVALARLEADGIVQQPVNLRARVRDGAENWLVDIHRIRQFVEPEAARSSAGKIPEAVLADLEVLRRDAQPSREEDWFAAARYFDYALHLVVAEYCGNLPLRETMRRCWSYKRISYEAGEDSERNLRQGYRQHAALLEKLAAGDGEGAAELMAEHLRAAARMKPGGRIL